MSDSTDANGDEVVHSTSSESPQPQEPAPMDDPNLRLLSGKNGSASKRPSVAKRPNEAEADEEVTYEESRDLMKSYHKFDNEPIFIPSDAVVRPKKTDNAAVPTKVRKVDSVDEKEEDSEEELDVDEMMSCFDDKLIDS